MSAVRNMSVLSIDIDNAVVLLLEILRRTPSLNVEKLADLASPLTSDIALARKRFALGDTVNKEFRRSDRPDVNRILFTTFEGHPEAPQIHYEEGQPVLITRAWRELQEFVHKEESPPSKKHRGRPRLVDDPAWREANNVMSWVDRDGNRRRD